LLKRSAEPHDFCAPRSKATRLAPGARFCDFFVSAARPAGSARSVLAAMMLLWVVMAVAVRRWQRLLTVAI